MKALITGGAGFIGYHLSCELLNRGYEVHILDDFSRGLNDKFIKRIEKNVSVISCDLSDKGIINSLDKDYDYIFHFAAIIGVQNVLKKPYDVLYKNTELLINTIEFAKVNKNLKRFVFASTSEIYAGTLKYYGIDIPTPEDTPLTITPFDSPRTSYMLSKIYGEALLYQSGLPFTIIRPHNIYGPRMGMSHVIPELLRKTYFDENNGVLDVYSAGHKRTFCYISDAIEMIIRLAESEKSIGESYNIGNESPEISMREVADLVLCVVGRNYQINELPPTEGSPERRCPKMEKTNKAIGYSGKITIKEGIEKTFKWYKDNIFDGDEISAK